MGNNIFTRQEKQQKPRSGAVKDFLTGALRMEGRREELHRRSPGMKRDVPEKEHPWFS